MAAVTVPWLAVCALLATAGAAKVRRPEPTMGALAAARLPSTRRKVLALGIGEVALAVVAVATGAAVIAASVAVVYAAFAVFVGVALRRDGMLLTCGCFGSPDVPATGLHLIMNVLACATAVVAAATEVSSFTDLVAREPDGLLAAGLAVVATGQLLVVLTILPRARMASVARTAPRLRW